MPLIVNLGLDSWRIAAGESALEPLHVLRSAAEQILYGRFDIWIPVRRINWIEERPFNSDFRNSCWMIGRASHTVNGRCLTSIGKQSDTVHASSYA
jgi:hypothetical protein